MHFVCRFHFRHRQFYKDLRLAVFSFILLCNIFLAKSNFTDNAHYQSENLRPSNGKGILNRPQTQLLESLPARGTCTEYDYEITLRRICVSGPFSRFRCIGYVDGRRTLKDAQRVCKEVHGGHLAYLKTEIDNQKVQSFFIRSALPRDWCYFTGLHRMYYKDGHHEWKWEDSTNATYEHWAIHKGVKTGDCVVYSPQMQGWRATSCSRLERTLCEWPLDGLLEEASSKPIITVEPNKQDFYPGEEFTLTCSSSAVGLNKSYIFADKINLDTFRTSTNLTYQKAGKYCIKTTVVTAKWTMQERWHMCRFQCCAAIVHHKTFVVCSNFTKPLLNRGGKLVSSKPTLNVKPDDFIVPMGETFSCECISRTGSEDGGSIGLVTKDQKCKQWAWSTYLNGSFVPRWNMTACKITFLKSITVKGEKYVAKEGSHVITSRIDLIATGELRGARCYCFSYDAARLWANDGPWFAERRSRDFTDFSADLKIIFAAGRPQLDVAWPGTAPIVYGNRTLVAECTSVVGTGGALVWVLRTRDGHVVRLKSTYGVEPKNVPLGMSVRNYPRNTTCPKGWGGHQSKETCAGIGSRNHPKTWSQARVACKHKKADLVQIKDKEMNQVVFDMAGIDGYWIGLSDRQTRGVYKWLDEDTEATYTNWAPSARTQKSNPASRSRSKKVDPLQEEPGNTCALINGRTGRWHLHNCSLSLLYMCETAPGAYKIQDFFYTDSGPIIKSQLSLGINRSLEGATLQCRTEFTFLDKVTNLSTNTQPFLFKYTHGEPVFTGHRRTQGGVLYMDVSCAVSVGEAGVLSLVVHEKEEILHTYYVDLHKNVTHRGKGTPNVKFSRIEVTSAEATGLHIEAKATLAVTKELKHSFVHCFGYNVTKNSSFSIKNLTYDDHVSMAPSKEPYKFSPFPWVMISTVGVTIALSFMPFVVSFSGFYTSLAAEDNSTADSNEKAAKVLPSDMSIASASSYASSYLYSDGSSSVDPSEVDSMRGSEGSLRSQASSAFSGSSSIFSSSVDSGESEMNFNSETKSSRDAKSALSQLSLSS